MIHPACRFLGVLLIAIAALTPPALAELTIDITQPTVEPLPIAVPDFTAETAAGSEIGSQIATVINANLARSGLFRTIAQSAFIESPAAIWRLATD